MATKPADKAPSPVPEHKRVPGLERFHESVPTRDKRHDVRDTPKIDPVAPRENTGRPPPRK
ncbi:hypothetical protein BH10PSE18_BH10PSE18_18900 [soil metagenome]